MPKSRKNNERGEQVRKNERKPDRIEPLRPKAEATLKYRIANLRKQSAGDPEKVLHELQVYQIELEMQNEELRRTQKELEDSRSKYSDLYDFAPVGYFVFDKKGVIVKANLTGCQMLGVKRADLIKKPFHAFVDKDSQDRFYLHRLSVFNEAAKQSCEITLVKKDGNKIESLIESEKAADADGNYTLCHTTITDITAQKLAEEKLKAGEERFRSLFEQAADAIVVVNPRTEEIVEFNDNTPKMLGYTRKEFAKLKLSDISTESQEGIKFRTETILRHGIDAFETRQKKKDGTLCDVLVSTKLITIGDKKLVQAVWQDITEQKSMEKTLEKERQELKLIIDSSPILLFYKDTKGRFVRVNKVFAEAMDIPEEKFLGKTVFDSFSAKIAQSMANDDQEVLRSGRPKLNILEQYESAKGLRWVQTDKIPIFDKDGTLTGLVGFAQDVTERKLADEMLRTSEAKLSNAMKIAKLGYWEYDAVKDLFTFNDQFYSIFRTTAERVGGYTMSSARYAELFLPPEDRNVVGIEVKKAIEATDPNFSSQLEHRIIYADGEIGYIAVRFFIIKDSQGRTIKTYGANQDITERKAAEEALRDSVVKFHTAFHTSPNLMAITTLQESRFIEVNEAYCQVTGFTREECTGHTALDLNLWASKKQREKIIQKVKAEGCVKNVEVTLRTKSGEMRALIFSGSTITLNNEKYLLSVATDITDRKLAEETLANERNLLRTLIDHIPDRVYIKDKDARFIVCNKTLSKYWKGLGENTLLGKTDFDLFEPARAKEFFDKEQEMMRTGQPILNQEGYCTDRTGKTYYLLITKLPLRDSAGNVIGLLGIHRDITKRKSAEEKLLEHQKQLNRLAAQLALAEERERRRIAGELHDNVNQSLALAKIKLDSLHAALSSQPLAGVIENISSSIEKAIQDTRTLTFDLSNPILYELGFEAAVAEWLNENVRDKHKINTEFQDDGQDKPLDDDTRALLFRNVRELLINTIKHANADKVGVSVRRIDDSIEVTVEDNGVGFDPVEVRTLASKRAEFGLFSIRESIQQLGGHFKIESKPGKGCIATIIAPLKSQTPGKEE